MIRYIVASILIFTILAAATTGLTTTHNITFTSDVGGFTGGTHNSTLGALQIDTNYSFINSPNLSVSSYSYWEITFRGKFSTNHTNLKAFMAETENSADDDHLLCDADNSKQRCRIEPEYDRECSNIAFNEWNTYKFAGEVNDISAVILNFTVNSSTANCTWTKGVSLDTYAGDDFFRISTGEMPNGASFIDNFTMQILDSEYVPPTVTNITSVRISPSPIAENQDAMGFVLGNSSSAFLNYSCSWYVNNVLIAGPVLDNRSTGVEQQTASFPESNYVANDNLTFGCTATNGTVTTAQTNTSLVVTAVGGSGGGGGGSGGGGGGSTQTIFLNEAGVDLIDPEIGFLDVYCYPNKTKSNIPVKIFNYLGTDAKYTVSIQNHTCSPVGEISVEAKTQAEFMMSCTCPAPNTVESGKIIIQDNRANGQTVKEIPFTLRPSIISVLMSKEVGSYAILAVLAAITVYVIAGAL